MAKRFLVVGLGRFGTALAVSLARAGRDVVAVDRALQPVDDIKNLVGYAAAIDATSPEALSELDCGTVACAVVAIGEDFEATVLCVAALREVGVETVVARAQTARQARILSLVGATEVIQLEQDAGRRLAAHLAGGREPSA